MFDKFKKKSDEDSDEKDEAIVAIKKKKIEEHEEYDRNFLKKPVKVFEFYANPYLLMSFCTSLTVILFFIFIFICLQLPVTEQVHDNLPSISAIIAHSKAMTITFTMIVYIHSYSLYSYLVIMSQYLGTRSISFIITSMLCFLYIFFLIIVSYLPLTTNEMKHNIFAMAAFFTAILSVYLHKHTLIVYSLNDYPVMNSREGLLILSEIFVLILLLVSGCLFWFNNSMWAEYLFIFLIIIDKQIKVMVLVGTNLLYLEGSYMLYTYYAPPNPLDPNIESEYGFS